MTTEVLFDEDLMRRYDREGPRYTSYPTALQFHEGIDVARYASAASTSPGAAARAPLSIYDHIPFCREPCFYCGCNKIITRQMDRADAYLVRLRREIELRSEYFDRSREVEQLHFGGGTPTFLTQDRLAETIACIDRRFRLTTAAHRDYSIEIDPRTVDPERLAALAGLGFNRISLGVQDYDPEVQRAVNRFQPVESVTRLVEAARRLGFRSLNFDLIYGLPRQSLETLAATLRTVVDQRPDRLAVYGYAHMPQTFKAQRQIEPRDLPGPALRLALLQLAIETLSAAGYVYIGMDHFALPEDSLAQAQANGTMHRTFQGYTTHASRDLVSLGVSAIGQVGRLYVQNQKSLALYSAALDQNRLPLHRGVEMSVDDELRRDVIQQIMCHGGVDVDEIERRHAIRFDTHFADELVRLQTLTADGLVERRDRHIALTPRGRLLMRNVAMVFDAYKNAGAGAPRLSRVI